MYFSYFLFHIFSLCFNGTCVPLRYPFSAGIFGNALEVLQKGGVSLMSPVPICAWPLSALWVGFWCSESMFSVLHDTCSDLWKFESGEACGSLSAVSPEHGRVRQLCGRVFSSSSSLATLICLLSVDWGTAQRFCPAVSHFHDTGRKDMGPAFPQIVENSVWQTTACEYILTSSFGKRSFTVWEVFMKENLDWVSKDEETPDYYLSMKYQKYLQMLWQRVKTCWFLNEDVS